MFNNFTADDNVECFVAEFEWQGGEIAAPLPNTHLPIVLVQSIILHEHRQIPSRDIESVARSYQSGSDYAAECANFQNTNLPGRVSRLSQLHDICYCSYIGSAKSLPVIRVRESYFNLRIGFEHFADDLIWR